MQFLIFLIYVIVLGLAAHLIGEAIPRRWFLWWRFPYRPWRWERAGRIYERMGIRAWKDRLPDKSRVVKGMVPKRLGRCLSSETVFRLVRETCLAEAVHLALCLCVLPVGVWLAGEGGVFFAAVYILGNLPFIMIQRYNRPALVSLGERLKKREERRKNAGADPIGEYGGRS